MTLFLVACGGSNGTTEEVPLSKKTDAAQKDTAVDGEPNPASQDFASVGVAEVAQKHIAAGDELYKEGQVEASIAEYDKAIRLDPEDSLAYHVRALRYDELGQFERAIQDYNEAIRLYPQDYLAHQSRGSDYQELGQHQQAIHLKPQLKFALNSRGRSYSALGQHQRAIRINPRYGDAYFNRAIAFTLLGKDLEAGKDVQRAVELGIDRAKLEQAIEDLKAQR